MRLTEDSVTVSPANRKKPNHLLRVVGSLLALVFVAALGVFLFVGDWLVSEDPLQPADAIVVLSGGIPQRALEAAKLYREGYAARVWLTRPEEPGRSVEALGVSYAGEDVYDREILVHQGVPDSAIEILTPSIRNTVDEISAVSHRISRPANPVVILVTSKVHTRRTRILCSHLTRDKMRAIVRGVSNDSFRPHHWWGSTTDALDVVRELLGIFNAWAGLPLQPAN